MIKRIDHIGICVRDLEASIKKYTSLLGLEVEEIEQIEEEDVTHRIAFFPVGGTPIELLHTNANEGLIADFIRDHGEGIHHIALEVEDLDKTFHELRSRGVEFLWDRIVEGSRESKIAFFKPQEFNGVYIELVQKH